MAPLRLALLASLLPAVALAQGVPQAASTASKAFVPSVQKKPTEIEAKGFLGIIGQHITPHATLKQKETGAPIAGRSVVLFVAGVRSGLTETNASGEAKFNYHVPNNPPGTWPVEIRFEGDLTLLPSKASVTMGVFKASTKLTFQDPPSDLREGDTWQIRGKLIRTSDGAHVDGRAVKLTVDGKSAGTPVTGAGGTGIYYNNYKLPADAAPKVRAVAQFEGDALYAPTSAERDVNVKPPPKPAVKGKLIPEEGNGKRGETITLKALLVPENPMVVVNGLAGGVKVTFKASIQLPGPVTDLCSTTTLSDGRASCSAKLDLPQKSYTLSAMDCCTDGAWEITRVNRRLDIGPSPVHIALTGPSSARIGDTIQLKAKLTRTTDGKALAGKHVSGLGQYGDTDATGEIRLTGKVFAQGGIGARSFKANFAGETGFYGSGEGSITIQVQPSIN